jgi:hypothetical protein
VRSRHEKSCLSQLWLPCVFPVPLITNGKPDQEMPDIIVQSSRQALAALYLFNHVSFLIEPSNNVRRIHENGASMRSKSVARCYKSVTLSPVLADPVSCRSPFAKEGNPCLVENTGPFQSSGLRSIVPLQTLIPITNITLHRALKHYGIEPSTRSGILLGSSLCVVLFWDGFC